MTQIFKVPEIFTAIAIGEWIEKKNCRFAIVQGAKSGIMEEKLELMEGTNE